MLSLIRPALTRRACAALLSLWSLSACAAPARDAARTDPCRPVKQVELPLREARNFLLTPATLEGRAVTMLVDTGAETTTLTPQAAVALKLPRDAAHTRTLVGVTGNVSSAGARLHELALAGQPIGGPRNVGVGDLPSLEGIDPPIAGLLGADVLAGFDVELDLPDGRMALYSPSTCPDWRPWAGGVQANFRRGHGGLAYLDVQVDGRAVRALLDTGARTSLLTREAALALGVTEATLEGDMARTGRGVGGGTLTLREHRFAAFGLPGAIARDMTLNVADLPLAGAELLLGVDYLGHRHVWISYAASRLYLR
jgi:predicted aspartyl protease